MAHVLKAEYTDQQSLQGFRYFSLDIFQALIPLCHCCEAGATNWLGFSLPTYLSFMMLPPQSCRAGAELATALNIILALQTQPLFEGF